MQIKFTLFSYRYVYIILFIIYHELDQLNIGNRVAKLYYINKFTIYKFVAMHIMVMLKRKKRVKCITALTKKIIYYYRRNGFIL